MTTTNWTLLQKMKLVVTDEHNTRDAILQRVMAEKCRKGSDDPFYVVSIDDVVWQCNEWKASLPRVLPFYGGFNMYSTVTVGYMQRPAVLRKVIF